MYVYNFFADMTEYELLQTTQFLNNRLDES